MADIHEKNGVETVSLEEVKRRYYPAVFGRINIKIRHDMDADVMASECFVRLANYKKPIDNVGALLFTIADNIVRDEFRKRKPPVFVYIDDDNKEGRRFDKPDPRPWKPEEQEQQMVEREEREARFEAQHKALHSYLNELPSWKYDIYVMRSIDKESFDAIAEKVGMSRDRVKYHFNIISANVIYNARKRYSARAARNDG